MGIQFLGHKKGCLDWFDTIEAENCNPSPSPTPSPSPPVSCGDLYCYWVNYQTYPSQEPVTGGWYLYSSDCLPPCGCSDPTCGGAPPPDQFGECVSPCVANPNA